LFLLTTKAAGSSINLVADNRVIIFNTSWKAADDLQSIYRVYRLGQIKPCHVYRFLAHGTMEDKIYNRLVVDHFKKAELKELYVYKPLFVV
jgi:transcriptional regulator ATRX